MFLASAVRFQGDRAKDLTPIEGAVDRAKDLTPINFSYSSYRA